MINKVLLMEFFKDDDIKVVDKDFYIKSQMKSDVIKYITILEEENERLKKENTILKENAEHNDKVVDKARWNEMIYKSRCDLAYEYIIRHKRKDGFLNLNEWQTEELLKNIGGKE